MFNPLQIIYGVVAVAIVTAIGAYVWDCEREKEQFAVYKAEVKVLGEEAEKKAKAQEARDKVRKEKTDADHQATVARLNRDLKRMRDAHARSSLVPAATATSSRADLACFDRADFAGALRDYETAVEGLIGEGAAATIDLNAAKEWARSSP